jgi:predicted MFS family arabinose efflux permease
VLRGGLTGLSASAVFALIPVLATQGLHADARVYGLLLASCGTGAVCCAYAGAALRRRFTPDEVLRISVCVLMTGLATLGFAPQAWIAGIGAALGGAGWTLAHSTYNTAVQLSAEPQFCGRSLATYQTLTFAGLASGSAGLGWIAGHENVHVAFLVASVAQGAAGLVAPWLALPRLKTG